MKNQINLFFAVFLSCVCLIAGMFLCSSPARAQGFMVKPMKMEFQLRPGETIEKVLELRNTGADKTRTIDLKLMELTQSKTGAWCLIEPGSDVDTSNLSSCLKWIELSANSVEVKPLEMAPVKVKLTVPRRTHGFYAAALIAQTRPPKPKTGRIGVVIRFLIPVLVGIQGRPPRQKIELTNADMQFLEQSEKRATTSLVSINIVNKGETYSRLKGNINVMRRAGEHWQRVASAEFGDIGIIPGVTLNLTKDLQRRLPSGKYKLQATLAVDGRRMRPLVKEIDFVGDPTVTEAAADTPLILEPSTLSIRAIPGSVRTTVIKVQNPSEEVVNISAGVEVPKSLQGVSLDKLKGEDLTCAEWVEVVPQNFTLRPGGRRIIRVMARLPKNLEMHANYYAALGLRAVYADGQSAGETRSLVCVQNAKMEARPVAQAVKVSLAAEEGSKYIVRARFANVGNIHFTPRCKATVEKADGTPVLETALSGQTEVMLPLGTGDFSGILDFSRVEAGVYRLTALIDYGREAKPVSKILPVRVSVEEGQKVVTAISVNAK